MAKGAEAGTGALTVDLKSANNCVKSIWAWGDLRRFSRAASILAGCEVDGIGGTPVDSEADVEVIEGVGNTMG